MATSVSTIHIVRVIDVMLSADGWTSSWTLNGAERLIDHRKVETSSTSLNIHATFFYSRPSCRDLKLYFAKGASLFYGSIRILFFLSTSSFCFSSSYSPVLHTVSSFALLSALNGRNRRNALAIVIGIDFTSLTLESNFRRS